MPGHSAKSPLIYYISRLVPDMEMPPEGRGKPLTREQIGLFRAWIDQGVPWEQTPKQPIQVAASPTVGWTTVKGDQKKFRELYWQHEGWNGGLESFGMTNLPSPDSKITTAGHVLLHDYKLTLSAEKNALGFTRFGWSQYRKYFDDSGGYYPFFAPPILDLNRDLYLDIGRAWADFGLTLPRWPTMVLGYEYQYRDGAKSTTQWGPVSDGTETRNIYPAFKDLSEHVHILKFDADYETDTARVSDSFRGEWYSLATGRQNDSFDQLGAAAMATTTADEKQSYFQGANTVHVEKQFTGWLFTSGGYLYSRFDGDASVNVTTMNPALLSPALPFPPGWNANDIALWRESHVFSVSTLLGPWQGWSLSLGSQNEWTRQSGMGSATANLAVPFSPFFLALAPEDFFSDYDRATFTQEAGLRFTSIPFTTLFAEARLQEEDIGQTVDETGDLAPYLVETDARSTLKDLRTGFNTSPWRRVMLSAHYRYYDNHSDYNNFLRQAAGGPYEGYPGFILWRDLLSREAVVKLSLQATPWLKTTLSYQLLDNKYHTATDTVAGGIAPGGGLLAGTYQAQTATLNSTLTPWRRLFLSTTFSYQNARTVTAANDSPSVAPYAGDIYSVMAGASYILNTNTDLSASYSLSMANFSQDNFADGLPLGIKYQQHGVQVGVKRRIGKGRAISLRYSFYHYDEPSSGGFNNFNAQAIFATLSFQFQ